MVSQQKYLNFNTDPDLNNAAPPQGSPQGMNASDLNNVDRYDKAAIADMALDTVTNGIGIQTPDAVAFTGGAISGLTAISADVSFSPSADADLTTKAYVDAQIETVEPLINAIIDTLEPIGTVKLFNGLTASLPTYGTWQICDGTNGTLDLRSVFPKGCDTDLNLGDTGGSLSGTTDGTAISISQLPSHTHDPGTLVAASVANHGHSFVTANNESDVNPTDDNGRFVMKDSTLGVSVPPNTGPAVENAAIGGGGAHSHSVNGATASAGSDAAHDHTITLPENPYVRIYFIQRTA